MKIVMRALCVWNSKMPRLPFHIAHVGVPPIKCQGIKTKLVPFIFDHLIWDEGTEGRWIEPFLGSGVVVMNLAPQRALLADTNAHVIGFYRAIQRGEITQAVLRDYLESEGRKLEAGGADHYYKVRQRFNEQGSPFDFLFLNRSCFNGVMRFNLQGEFNVPFGHKPLRFTRAYVTKIVNQVGWVACQMQGKEWEFRVGRWDEVLQEAREPDFIYLDPPYIGRHTDYYNAWDEEQAERLARATCDLPCGFAASMWLENRHRKNSHVERCWAHVEMRVCSHFYHVGSTERLRNEMDEALLIKPGFATPDDGKQRTRKEPSASLQLSLAMEKRAMYRSG
jgi:DNA adenine methylase